MAVGDVYRVEVFWNIGSELTENVLHLKETSVSTADIPAQAAADVVYNILAVRVATLLFSEETKISLIKARRILPTTGVPATLIVGTATHPEIHGTNTGKPVPSASAALISFYTDLADANGRGRVYIPGIANSQQNDGQLVAGALTLFGAFADEFKATQVGVPPLDGEFEFQVYSRELNQVNKVEQAIAHSNMATQRGRRNFPGIGQ